MSDKSSLTEHVYSYCVLHLSSGHEGSPLSSERINVLIQIHGNIINVPCCVANHNP